MQMSKLAVVGLISSTTFINVFMPFWHKSSLKLLLWGDFFYLLLDYFDIFYEGRNTTSNFPSSINNFEVRKQLTLL